MHTGRMHLSSKTGFPAASVSRIVWGHGSVIGRWGRSGWIIDGSVGGGRSIPAPTLRACPWHVPLLRRGLVTYWGRSAYPRSGPHYHMPTTAPSTPCWTEWRSDCGWGKTIRVAQSHSGKTLNQKGKQINEISSIDVYQKRLVGIQKLDKTTF